MNDKILELIEQSDAIPSAPHLVTRLLELTADTQYRHADVANLLAIDPGVSADILRMANSALFGVARKVSDLRQALTLLGIQRVKTLVLGRCMAERLNAQKTRLIDTSYYWRRSLATAVLASRCAEQLNEPRDGAFMAGLLSDVGVVILCRGLNQAYAVAAQCYAPSPAELLIERERATVGVTHAEVGELALERWMLPESLVAAVRYHHEPNVDLIPERVRRPAAILHGASEIARLLCQAPQPMEIAARCNDALSRMNLPLAVLLPMLRRIESDVSEFAQILRVTIIPSRVYGQIASAIADQLAAPTV